MIHATRTACFQRPIYRKTRSMGQPTMGHEHMAGQFQQPLHPTRTHNLDSKLNKSGNIGGAMDFPIGRAARATTKITTDPERDLFIGRGSAPVPDSGAFPGSTSRRVGALHRFPRLTAAYPNPKKHRPIMVSPRPMMVKPHESGRMLARSKLPLEQKQKKIQLYWAYKRPQPPVVKTRHELTTRLRHGMFDLDRIMPPLWGPQEEFKLDQDEWMFKLLYFLHPCEEELLLSKAEAFPHCPFYNRKDMVLALERLVSREYVRRVTGATLRRDDLEPEDYYWTLMPDEVAYGEKVVVEENYLQMIREDKLVEDPVYPIRREMCLVDYQRKHNTIVHLEKERSVEKLEAFIEFCQEERKECRNRLQLIGKDTDHDPAPNPEEVVEYQDPPTMLGNPKGKMLWHHHGHWKDSVPDQRPYGPPIV
eukprot:TRINITY_DN70222_c0_g1_i1.p2 TRINITY_DN70222_c0_g1~~TRINITY_DN70222_c0_g1_i1.p2  ORF type:complete len:420 (+),score=146.37 TRINITY_DN70222_c0_g1_i1:131-1390(+)